MLPKPLHPGMSVMLRKFFSTFCVLTKSEISRGRSLVQGALTRGPETPQSFLERLQVLTRHQGHSHCNLYKWSALIFLKSQFFILICIF